MHAEALLDHIRRKAVWGGRVTAALAVLCAVAVSSCSDTTRTGTASSYLVLTTLTGGPKDDTTVESDVVSDSGSIFTDVGNAGLSVQMRDSLTAPSANNAITLTQYRVEYIRSDGHNVQGVDVPFAFTSGVTATISGDAPATVGFTLVRTQAKEEAPLKALRQGGSSHAISCVARITFYGADQTGREVTVVGNLDVTFADWAG